MSRLSSSLDLKVRQMVSKKIDSQPQSNSVFVSAGSSSTAAPPANHLDLATGAGRCLVAGQTARKSKGSRLQPAMLQIGGS